MFRPIVTIGSAVVICGLLSAPAEASANVYKNLRVLEHLAEYALQCASNIGTVSRVRVRMATMTDSKTLPILNYSGNYIISALGRSVAGTFHATALRVKKDYGWEVHHQALRWVEPTGSGVVHSAPTDACAPPPEIE